MAAKKDKPALFELIKKGPLKPDEKGGLSAPPWMRKSSPVEPDQPGSEPQPKAGLPRSGASAPGDEQPGATGIQRSLPDLCPDKRLTISVSYWALAAAALALLFLLVAAYRLGQFNPSAPAGSLEPSSQFDTPPSDRLREVTDSAPQPDVFRADPTDKVTPAASESVPPGRPRQDKLASLSGQRLIICGDRSAGNLKAVQQVFAKSGVATKIGKSQGRYVLYSQQSFTSGKSPAAVAFKEHVAQIGATYNRKKPRNAPSFRPSTFAADSTYTVNSADIVEVRN